MHPRGHLFTLSKGKVVRRIRTAIGGAELACLGYIWFALLLEDEITGCGSIDERVRSRA